MDRVIYEETIKSLKRKIEELEEDIENLQEALDGEISPNFGQSKL